MIVLPPRGAHGERGWAVRPIRIEGATAFVPLTRGKEAVIDVADAELVAGRNWQAIPAKHRNGTFYAMTSVYDPTTGRCRSYQMHRVIASSDGGPEIDHRDGDGLNNRRSNLREATRSQNMANKRTAKHVSGTKGVWFNKKKRRYIATVAGRVVGHFRSEQEAVAAYDAALVVRYGEFALTNGERHAALT